MRQIGRERCWVTHKRQPYWNMCPLCGVPVKWVRLWDGTFSPCDYEPVLFTPKKSPTRLKVVVKRELIENISLYIPAGIKPRYGHLPHYYSCPVLIKERRAWAKNNRQEG